MLDIVFSFVFFAATCAVLGLSARSDWRGMVIPNEYALALVGLFVFGAILPKSVFDGVTFTSGLFASGIVFVFTIALYASRAMGGGDTKLASAVALLIGTKHLSLFLLVMAFSGGFIAIYALLTRSYGHKLLPAAPAEGTWLARLKAGENKVPYGIAIAVGAIVALFQKWLMPVFSGVW